MTAARIGTIGGQAIEEVVLRSAAGAEAKVITFGAIVRDLTVPTPRGPQRVVLGLDDIEGYASTARHMGAIVGRYGNRIGRGRFSLDDETYRLDLNENRLDPAGPGRQHLHGGAKGFSQRAWTVVDHTANGATLALISDDGDMGYPGRLVATCTYTLVEPATLRLVLEATADRATPVNLTTHLYYDLDGSPDILDHTLEIAAGHVTPTDEELIPTGEVRSVAGTPYDFRSARPIRDGMRGGAVDYDINYVLSGPRGALNRAATLASAKSGVALELWTTEPGLQFYGGHKLAVPSGALGGGAYGRHGGLCLEPQRFPDGPNEPHFPPCVLRPGEVSRQVSELRLFAGPPCTV
jgi:aldose 1-epimerase